MMELGYSVCSSLEECRRKLLALADGCVPSVVFSPQSIAKVLSMMIRTHTGLDSQLSLPYSLGIKDHDVENVSSFVKCTTWNVEIFVKTIKELV